MVLNAFRHQRTVHSLVRSVSDCIANTCSTPFGINELFTLRGRSACEGRFECSTPFGINELFTEAGTGELYRTPCAQRLSASTNCSRAESPESARLELCSTPFGINELFTGLTQWQAIGLLGAQRLSASTNCSPLESRSAWRATRLCAQRLSASTNCSQNSSRHPFPILRVLNAFRHQRTVHDCVEVDS